MNPLEQTLAAYGKWLHLPDTRALLAILGAIAANRLEGDPVWLLVVGPPGGGKSEQLQGATGLPDVHSAATLTEAALLSGTPKREQGKEAKGGLLKQIGDFGIIVCKDFGSVLSMHRDARAALLAALREVYDGSWTRHVGTDGGKTLHWAGKVGLIAGCTPTIDRHHAVMGAMGERFILFRLPEVDADEQARRALDHAGRERQMRAELGAAVENLFAAGLAGPRAVTDDERDQLVSLSTLVVRCRSAVERDGHTRDIELIPEPEAPTRMIVVLERLLAGLDAIGVDRDAAWSVVRKAALDSIPAIRLAVLFVLHEADGALSTNGVAQTIRYPVQTSRRALEDLTAHRLVLRSKQGNGQADLWTLTRWAQERLGSTVPEMSAGVYTPPPRVFDDFSGTVPMAQEGEAS